MRLISIDRVLPGMVTARNVYPPGESAGLPLLAAKVLITEAIRDRLVKAKITQIAIDDDLSEGIDAQPPITDEVRRGALTTLRSTFTELKKPEAVLTKEQLAEVESTISSIMTEIASRKNLLVALSDLNMFGGARMEHAVNVCVVGCAIARKFFEEHGWRDFRGQRRDDQLPDRLQKLGIGLLLQDIGSMAIPDAIWDKRGLLTAEERALMQTHPLVGVEMLEGSDVSPLTKVTIAQHHERYDGSGYPRGLAGDEIHDNGQVAAIAEAYVSLCNEEQGGRRRFAPHEAYSLILQAGGRLFHPNMVEAFASAVAPYGPGTTVQLSDGKYGIVVSNNAEDPLRPVVRVTHDADGLIFTPQFDLDLTRESDVEIVGATDGLPSDEVATTRR